MGYLKETRMAYADEIARIIADKYLRMGMKKVGDFTTEDMCNALSRDVAEMICQTLLVKFYCMYSKIVFRLLKFKLHRGK